MTKGRSVAMSVLVNVCVGTALLSAANDSFAQSAPNNPVGLWRLEWSWDNTAPMVNNSFWNICFLPNGTWYSGPTMPFFSGWHGLWFQKGDNAAGIGDHVSMVGNYAANVGNDVFQMDFVHVNLMTGTWAEWRDNFVTHYWDRAMLTRAGTCKAQTPAEQKAMMERAAQDKTLESADPGKGSR